MEQTSCKVYDVGCWLGWLSEEIQAILLEMWLAILNGLATLIESIPVPEFLTQITGASFQLSPYVIYFLELFHVAYGFGIVVAAYVLRFILRRIPLIG